MLERDFPVESMVHGHQQEYYRAINESNDKSDSAPFISFILGMVRDAVTPQVTPQVAELLAVLKGDMSRSELQHALKLADRKSFRERYLRPALEHGVVEMTIPDKPNSRLQKYRLTVQGEQYK